MIVSSYTIYKLRKEDLARVLYTLIKTVDIEGDSVLLFKSDIKPGNLYLALKKTNDDLELCFESSLWRQKEDLLVELEPDYYVERVKGEVSLWNRNDEVIIGVEVPWKVW